MTEREIIKLIKTGQLDKLEPTVRQELEEWILEAENNRIGLDEFLRYINDLKDLSEITNVDSAKAWRQISRSINKRKRLNTGLFLRAAASVAILVAISTTILLVRNNIDSTSATDISYSDIATPGEYKAVLELANGEKHSLSDNKPLVLVDQNGAVIMTDSTDQLNYTMNRGREVADVTNSLYVPRGGVYSLILSDGTKVWLNSDSELTYPAVFNNSQRTVHLKGEAYFEVVEDMDRPFTVDTENQSIRVLGTRFNVSAYDKQEYITTTLVEGSVNIISDRDESVILSPGQQSLLDKRYNMISVEEVNASTYISWVKGIFEFENMRLENIALQLERWYDVDIEFTNSDLKDLHFTGAVERDRSIEIIMEMISKTSKVSFSIKEDHIAVSGK